MTYDSTTGPRLTPGPTCADYTPLLPLLPTGELTDEQAAATREHLANCAFCRHRVAEYDTLYAALRSRFDPDAVAAGVVIPAASEIARFSAGSPRSFGPDVTAAGSRIPATNEIAQLSDEGLPPSELEEPDHSGSSVRRYVARPRLPHWFEAIAALLLISLLGGLLVWQRGSSLGGLAPLDAQEQAYVAVLREYYLPLLDAQGAEGRQCVTAFDSSPTQLQAMTDCRPLEVTAQTASQTLLSQLQAASTPPRWKDADTQLKAWAQGEITFYTNRIQAIDAHDAGTFKTLGDQGTNDLSECTAIEQINADLPADSQLPPNASGYCGT